MASSRRKAENERVGRKFTNENTIFRRSGVLCADSGRCTGKGASRLCRGVRRQEARTPGRCRLEGGTDKPARVDSCGRNRAGRQSNELDGGSRQPERALAARLHQSERGSRHAGGGGWLSIQGRILAGQRQRYYAA